MRIESRYNWLMGGIVGSMIALQQPPILYVVFLIVISILISLSCSKLLGPGDTESLTWIVLGLGFISIPRLLIFLMFFIAILAVYLTFKWGFSIKIKTPGMPVLLGAFFITAIIIC